MYVKPHLLIQSMVCRERRSCHVEEALDNGDPWLACADAAVASNRAAGAAKYTWSAAILLARPLAYVELAVRTGHDDLLRRVLHDNDVLHDGWNAPQIIW